MNWESFIDNLTAGQIVPVIGNDLILMKDENNIPAPLYDHIARELTRRLDVPYTGQDIGELATLHSNANIMATSGAIFKKMNDNRFYLDSLNKLAEITDFKFFISTTWDDLLVKSLRKARNLKDNQLRVINYSLQKYSDIPSDDEEDDSAVTVFNVLGSFGNVLKPAVDEEEMLENFLSLSNKYQNPLADYLMKRIQNKILLFIGCNFPDWLMRFIIRIITGERYRDRSHNDYIIWNELNKFTKLHTFLIQHKKIIFAPSEAPIGSIRLFIDELHQRWLDALKNQPIQYQGTVFLSYNHPDRETAKELKKLLRAAGIRNVWFDIDDLNVGEHRINIENEIKKCDIFIPLISNHSLTHTDSYVRTVEWALIKGRWDADKYYGKLNFQLIPVIIDDTERGDKRIPKFMRKFAMWNFPGNKECLLDMICKALKPLC
ncbi:MAG: toll/interleukin-1 receptor domain-containing protein [Candidatus Omnitrophota bacterium]